MEDVRMLAVDDNVPPTRFANVHLPTRGLESGPRPADRRRVASGSIAGPQVDVRDRFSTRQAAPSLEDGGAAVSSSTASSAARSLVQPASVRLAYSG
jgi:hypothetical protein